MTKQTKITKSARGQDCQVRVPGICDCQPDTTVFAHLNGAGMGTKHADYLGAYAGLKCHWWLDGGYTSTGHTREYRDLIHLEGMARTLPKLVEQGLLEVK